jgi:site-specific recombinase
MATWDLTALFNAADAKASQAERHLWLARLMEWLRHAPVKPAARTSNAAGSISPTPPDARPDSQTDGRPPSESAADTPVMPGAAPRTPQALVRLRHLLNRLDAQPELRDRVQAMLAAFWRDIDAASLFADFGFGARVSLGSELLTRLQRQLLPRTPDTHDLAGLFELLFRPDDAAWLDALDGPTLDRVAALLGPGAQSWRTTLMEAITILVSAIHSAGFSPSLRQRMDPALLKDAPFRQLTRAADNLRRAVLEERQADALHEASYLRAVLDGCRRAAASVTGHLEAYGVSVDIVYELDQLQGRAARVEQLVSCVLAPEPVAEWQRLLVRLVQTQAEVQGLRALLTQQYSLLARQVAERNAETGEHYITRDSDEYRDMLGRAAGGGAVLAATTFVKFAIATLGLTAFWTGFWSGANYAASFVLVMLLHWTIATKQPAMTAPALAASLPATSSATEPQIEAFVDRVAALIRSQAAGILGNLALCGPLVLGVQLACVAAFGQPLVGHQEAEYVLDSLTLLGPTLLFAAFTGVLLFASSLIAGWAENWFVFHRLDSAIAWNPRIRARLGAARARRWAAWWRTNVSSVAANVSLGMMLGLVPALTGFVGLDLEVRHVTLSTGQLGAALGALGLPALGLAAFWWCVAGIVLTGVLNVVVSFYLAFKLALRSRGVRVRDRQRIAAALRRRLRTQPLSFLKPPRDWGDGLQR